MNHQFQTVLSKFIVMCMFVLVGSGFAFPYMTNNHSEVAFAGGPSQAATVSIEELIVTGAGYYLESYASLLYTLQYVELNQPGQFNAQVFLPLLDKTLLAMKKANETYITLKQVADMSAYNAVVLDYLITFDFDGFAQANSLRAEAFARVKRHLAAGNTRAVYSEMVRDTANLYALLLQVKAEVNNGAFPAIPALWKINQAYTDTLLFGQYVAQVFDRAIADIYGKK